MTYRPKRAIRASAALLVGVLVSGTGAPVSGALIPRQAADLTSYELPTAADAARIRALLAVFKADPRGPYLRIRWFCNDGSTRAPQEGNCRERGGGHQHAELKPEAAALSRLGYHPGTILMATPFEAFADAERGHDRLRELVVEQYLIEADDGWVLRRARSYRGARQIEDEDARGRQYLERLLADGPWRSRNGLLAGLLVRSVPHGAVGVPGARIRQLAEDMAALDARLQDLRIKLHSRPGPSDLDALRRFRGDNRALAPELQAILDELERELTSIYRDAFDTRRWTAFATALGDGPLSRRLRAVAATASNRDNPRAQVAALAGVLRAARHELDHPPPTTTGGDVLAIYDLIHYADALLRAAAATWIDAEGSRPAASRRELLGLAHDLVDAAYGTGWLTEREHRALASQRAYDDAAVPAAIYRDRIEYLASAIDWSQGALRQAFGSVLARYRVVEDAVHGFEDAMLRGSALLALANVLDPLARDAALAVGVRHSILDLREPGRVVGLNPGLAIGPLQIVDDASEIEHIRPGSIAVIPETDAELGRVAGILTLQEGSRLSHVQLLARSLGLPNAAISPALVEALRPYQGVELFYAVSGLGTVVMKPRADLNEADLALVSGGSREAAAERFSIDESKLDLATRRLLTLDEIDLADSGRIVGPKAANLARLRRQFPDRVAQGIVVPFGVFRRHVDRDLLGTGATLYSDLASYYRTAREMERRGVAPERVQAWILARLREVRQAIQTMELLPDFEAELRVAAARTFGPDGSYGVFVRSDTNVEDLPNFTGAGLNLTVMNQIGVDHVLHAIRQVWASPFSERSFTWRQQLLDNPEQVYPSVLLLQSVGADASGVLATVDLTRGAPDTWTVTLSEGIGGVVDGEPAESMLVPAGGGEPVLLSSARAAWQKVLRLTGAGGIDRVPVRGEPVLLTEARLADLRDVVHQVLERYEPVVDTDGNTLPWDIEFGFLADRVVLFQIRPLVTNRRVRTLQALSALDAAGVASDYGPVTLDDRPRSQ